MVVYIGRVFSVEVDKVTLSNGHETELAIVRHRPSVVLIPVQDDGRIVMIRQYRHAVERDIWELPAGNVNDGESAEAAAARALRRKILWRPRAKLLAEPAPLVAARQREQRGGVSLRGELHRRAGNAERLVIWMRVDEQRGADVVTLA